MQSASQPHQLCDTMYGALFFSAVMSTGFYSITCMQTYFYYVHYQNDRSRMKSFVAAVWALNTIHEALTVSGSYKYIMAGLEDPSKMPQGVPELVVQVLLTSLVATPTQGFFVYRIYIFSGKSFAAPLIWIPLAIFQIASSIIYQVKALYGDHGIHVARLENGLFMMMATSYLAVAAAVDILSAIFLTFLFLRKRNAACHSITAHVLQRLTIFAINTGIWTATFALLTLILLRVYPAKFTYTVFGIPLCSVYCNTLLANLNVRSYIRDEMTTTSAHLHASDVHKTTQRRESGKAYLMPIQEHLEHRACVTFLDIGRSVESEQA